jgi:hypothetical protein
MTQSTTTNGYTVTTMDSTDVYNYLKRKARKDSNSDIDCLAEAIIASYGDDTAISTQELKAVCACGSLSVLDYREMQCHVVTSMRIVPAYEAHCD